MHELALSVFILEFSTETFDVLAGKKGRSYLCVPGVLDLGNLKVLSPQQNSDLSIGNYCVYIELHLNVKTL